MSDIKTWLTELALEKYISVFADAEIDFETLTVLVEEDLKELGLPLGPRRKIWDTLSRQNKNRTPEPVPEAVEKDAALPSTENAKSEAERRHLTVMFVDMVGSTELSARIDAEDVRDVITGFQNTVAGIIGHFEGFVARFMGDGVLCYFGWPRANEDDAERAVRAGLSIIETVKKSSSPDGKPLSTRIGIASGKVIVGDLIGSGASEEAAVVGETPNLAARLQSLAGPDQLVLPDTTRKLLNNAFVLESTGSHSLKGIASPVEAFLVTAEVARESRFEINNTVSMRPLVGRKPELDLIREGWLSTLNGSGQMILLSGEAGIGKSRIVRAAIDEFKQNTPVRITFQCSPYHAESAFYPVIHQMQYAAGMSSTDSAVQRLRKLETLSGVAAINLSLLATMIGIDSTAGFVLPELTPAQLRTRTMDALLETLFQQASDKPLLVVFEDLHWIDPTTLEFLDLAIDSIRSHQIFILATARPTFVHGFGGHPDVQRFALNRLGREQVIAIVEKLTDNKPLPEEVLQIIHERTDGIPLFVEELTKTILESGVLKDVDGQLLLDRPLNAMSIPDTLRDSLMARLDRLQPIKEVAQMASCIGREFGHRLLMKVSPLPDNELSSALEGLIGAELIYRRGVPPEARYQFKHALVRDTAYESMLKPRRKAIHTAILQALESEQDVAPEVLATHAEAAGLTDRAIDFWEAASKAAIARPAFDEALTHLTHAIELITPRVDADDTAATNKALGLQVQLGWTLTARKGWAAIETKSAFQHALALADRVGETSLRFSILHGLMSVRILCGDIAEAVHHGKGFVDLAEQENDTAPALVANRIYGCALMLSGKHDVAQRHYDRALELFDPEKHAGLAEQYGVDLGVSCTALLSDNLYRCGESRRSNQIFQRCEHYAVNSKHVFSIGYMHWIGLLRSVMSLDNAELDRHASALALLATEHRLVMFNHFSALGIGLLMIERRENGAYEIFQEADSALMAMGSKISVVLMRIEAGHRWLTRGNVSLADEYILQSHTLIEENGEYYLLPVLYRLEARRACEQSEFNKAEQLLQKSLDVANDQGTRLYGLRAAIDYARLMKNQNRKADAITVLSAAYNDIADGDLLRERQEAADILFTVSAPASIQ